MSAQGRFVEYKGRSVLITGGLGFIGSNLAHALVDIGGVDVTILDSLVPGQGGNLHNIQGIRDRVTLHIGDMGSNSVINHLVGGVDYIFNLAGSVSHLDSMESPLRDLELNCAAQLTLLEACRRFNPHVKIIFTSTRQIYGTPIYLPLDERHRVEPPDINGIHKFAAEQYHLLYRRVYGIRSVILRLTNTYGPRQLVLHDRQSFIAWFIRQAMDGGVIELFGEGKQRRDVVYVDDVIEAMLLAGASETAEGEVFNLGGAEPILLSALAEELINLSGRGSIRCLPFPPERQSIEIGNAYSSYAKIQSVLGWRPRTSLLEGLTHTFQFYQKRHDQYWNVDADTLSRSQTTV
ncbi:NAD-dependent epimerase/dehydratase family protein [Edaphovirga cremea]|uniref:NAD-dependent epimerase/dehydratase family protein n=1 Tax=Edaphovirga cremea TaxID=2267246 RepID=UPI0039890CA8